MTAEGNILWNEFRRTGREGNILWNEFRRTGSRKDFKRLFDAYYDTLVRYAWWFLKSREDSEEVILDLMLHLWKNRESIDISESFHSYLRTSVRNRCLNRLRKTDLYVYLDIMQDIESPENVEAGLNMEDISSVVWAAMSSLSEKCQEVFSLSRKEGMKNSEIAERMGLSGKSVEAYITKSLKTIRLNLKKHMILLIFLEL